MPDVNSVQPVITFTDDRNAPIIYFEITPGLATIVGVISLTLATRIQVRIAGGQVDTRDVVVAHLRCTPAAAINLKAAIDQALLLDMPVAGEGGSN